MSPSFDFEADDLNFHQGLGKDTMGPIRQGLVVQMFNMKRVSDVIYCLKQVGNLKERSLSSV